MRHSNRFVLWKEWAPKQYALASVRTWLLIPVFAVSATGVANAADQIQWIEQFGTSAEDDVQAIDRDETGYAAAGMTTGALGGGNFGEHDAFLRRFDHEGNEIWTRQFGTSAEDVATSVAIDATGITVGGWTRGAFPGFSNPGDDDAFVRRYDMDGNVLWTDQFGTASRDNVYSVAADHRGIFVAGRVSFGQPVIRRYEFSGHLVWERVFGTPVTDLLFGITVDPAGVTVVGWTDGTFFPGTIPPAGFGTPDVILCRYDPDGNELWTRQFGTGDLDMGRSITSDDTGLTVAGFTTGSLPGFTNAGAQDSFVRRYDYSGNVLWTDQFGSPADDFATGVSAGEDSISIGGGVFGALPGQASYGGFDAYMRRYDLAGNELSTVQIGSAMDDTSRGIVADFAGATVVGPTSGAMPDNVSLGGRDAFIARFSSDSVIVDIDIKPWKDKNKVVPHAGGNIWVAILSNTEVSSPFDPSLQVDISSVRFGPDGAKVKRYKSRDINRDGLSDLLLVFRMRHTGIRCGDTETILSAETYDGQELIGSDPIWTYGCKHEGPPGQDEIKFDIDIKPWKDNNKVYPHAGGKIWVAILSNTAVSSPFDPSSQVDIWSVRFGPEGAKVKWYKTRDINRDGLSDVLLVFEVKRTGIRCGDTEAVLTAESYDGQRLTGTDAIRTYGCKK